MKNTAKFLSIRLEPHEPCWDYVIVDETIIIGMKLAKSRAYAERRLEEIKNLMNELEIVLIYEKSLEDARNLLKEAEDA